MNQIFQSIPQNLADNALKVCHKWKYKEINGCYVDPKRKLLFVNSFNDKPFLAQQKFQNQKNENSNLKKIDNNKSIYQCSVNEIDRRIQREYKKLYALQYPEEVAKMKQLKKQRLEIKKQKEDQQRQRIQSLARSDSKRCFEDFKRKVKKQKLLSKKLRPTFKPKQMLEDEIQQTYFCNLQGDLKDQVISNLAYQKRLQQKKQYQDIIDKFQIVFYDNNIKKRGQIQ